MSEKMYLIGSEEVRQAGQNMVNAAEIIQSAVNNLHGMLRHFSIEMEGWVQRLEAIQTETFDDGTA